MILYYSPKTRAFPVLWALEELGAEYELKFLNLGAGEQTTDDYRRVNPMMKVTVTLYSTPNRPSVHARSDEL